MTTPDTTVLLSLMAKARAPLEAQHASTPEDPAPVRRLAALCRTLGDLAAAGAWYEMLAGMPDGTAQDARMAALMRGETGATGWEDTAGRAVPFVRKAGFLDASERDAILSYALENARNFETLLVADNHLDGSQTGVRADALRSQSGMLKVPEIREIVEDPIRTALPGIIAALGMQPFGIREIRLSLSATRDGGFGKPHRDDINTSARISLLWYFHSNPKGFKSGDLMLYDRLEDPNGWDLTRATRIEHTDNMLIAFPCSAMHEITRVTCPSAEFRDARFAVAGFVIAD